MNHSAAIEDLIDELSTVKADQKELLAYEKKIKAELVELLEEEGLENVVADNGKLYFQTKKEKQYDQAIIDAELDLKERKKLADDLGDYTVISEKKSLVFTPIAS
jgi:organic radical activating enzyme